MKIYCAKWHSFLCPSEQTMKRITAALGVSFEEGLREHTPKRNGRPPGKKSEKTSEVRTHGK